jgi:hypothetical protein
MAASRTAGKDLVARHARMYAVPGGAGRRHARVRAGAGDRAHYGGAARVGRSLRVGSSSGRQAGCGGVPGLVGRDAVLGQLDPGNAEDASVTTPLIVAPGTQYYAFVDGTTTAHRFNLLKMVYDRP